MTPQQILALTLGTLALGYLIGMGTATIIYERHINRMNEAFEEYQKKVRKLFKKASKK